MDCLLYCQVCHQKMPHLQISRRKLHDYNHKTSTFTKFFIKVPRITVFESLLSITISFLSTFCLHVSDVTAVTWSRLSLCICSLNAHPVRASRWDTVWWTKSNFLGLFPKTVEDQRDCEISNYYVALPLRQNLFEYPYFFWVGFLHVARLHCRWSAH